MNLLEVTSPRRGPLPEAGRVDIWMADLDRVTDGFPAPLTLIDEGERQQAKRYRFDEDRRRFVARRAVLRELLGRHLGLHPSVVQIDRGPGAKPEVRGADAVYFNATASGSTALVAISGAEVGIDVERVADRTDLGLARRWLSARERSLHDRLDHRERERALFACLTKKEAVLKAAGVGLGIDPSLVSVPIDDATTPVEVPTLLPSLWWVRALTLPGRLVGALATADPEPTVNRFVLRELSSGRNALP